MRKVLLMSCTAAAFIAACHSSPPAETPAPQPSEAEVAMHRHMQDSLDAVARATADSIEQARLLAIAERARADSIEQARLAAVTAARLAAEQSTALRQELAVMVHFDVAQSQLLPDGRAALDRKIAILNANPAVRLQITGATDERGSDRYNVALGERRAAAVKRYLTDQGIDVARLDGISTGESSPIAAGSDEAAWAQNRRAEFAIVSGDTPLAMK
jgi:peptidoglycan-associated lipoprotein